MPTKTATSTRKATAVKRRKKSVPLAGRVQYKTHTNPQLPRQHAVALKKHEKLTAERTRLHRRIGTLNQMIAAVEGFLRGRP